MRDLKFVQDINSNSDGIATILLYDQIGDCVEKDGSITPGINGSAFASEIEYLQDKATAIHLRINSYGGSVLEGYSIIAAILNSKIPVYTFVDGLACSIAGVIAMMGEKKVMKDYATIMLHNPSGSPDQKVLDLIKDTLVTILTNNTKLTTEQISKLMDEETYFTAEDALAWGLVDSVITSNKKIAVDTTNLREMANIYNSLKPINEMIKIKNQLGLNNDVNETEVVDKIAELQNQIKELTDTLEAEKTAKETAENKLLLIEAAEMVEKENGILEMVNSFVQAGKIKDDEKDAMIVLARVDFNSVKNMLDKIGNKEAVKIFNSANVVNESKLSHRDLEKNDPKALAKIYKENPELAAKMYADEYKK